MDLFQSVATSVYRNDPVWAPPSEMLWRQRFQQLKQNPGAFVMPIVMLDNYEPVARCMIMIAPGARDEKGDPQGWIGFFECRKEFQEKARVMLGFGEKILLQNGARTALISKSDNQTAGILTSGFDLPHLVFTNHNPDYYFPLLESAGYARETRMVSLNFTRENAKELQIELVGIRTREFERSNLDREIEIFHSLQKEIFDGRAGYIPRTIEQDSQMVHSLLPFLEDELIIFAETTSGNPIGLLVSIPDFYQQMRGEVITRVRIISIGAIPSFSNKGVGALMGKHLMNNLLKNKNYQFAEGSWILSQNIPPQNLARRFNALPGKEYWMLKKILVQ